MRSATAYARSVAIDECPEGDDGELNLFMETIGWMVWGIVLVFALCGLYYLYVGLKQGLMPQTIATSGYHDKRNTY
jgi:hypothetical protein